MQLTGFMKERSINGNMTDFPMYLKAIISVFLFQHFVYSQTVCNFFRKFTVTYSVSSEDGQRQRSRLLCAEKCARDCLCLGFQYHREGSQLFPKRTCVLLKLDKYKNPSPDSQLVIAYIVITDYSKQELPCVLASNDSCSERRGVSNALVAQMNNAELASSSAASLSLMADTIIEASSTIFNSTLDANIQTVHSKDSTEMHSSFTNVYENHSSSVESVLLSPSVVEIDIDTITSSAISDLDQLATTNTNASDKDNSQKDILWIPSTVESSSDSVSAVVDTIYQEFSSAVIMTTSVSKTSVPGYTTTTLALYNAHVSSVLNPTSVSEALSMNKEYNSNTPVSSSGILQNNSQVYVSSSFSILTSVQEHYADSWHNVENTELSDVGSNFQSISVDSTDIIINQKESKVDSLIFHSLTWNYLAGSSTATDFKYSDEISGSYFMKPADTSTELTPVYLTTDADPEISEISYDQISSETETEIAHDNINSSLSSTSDRIQNVDSETTPLSIDFTSNFQNSMSDKTFELLDLSLTLSNSKLSTETGLIYEVSSAGDGEYSSETLNLIAVIIANSSSSQDRFSHSDAEETRPAAEVLSLLQSATHSPDLANTITTEDSLTTVSHSSALLSSPVPSISSSYASLSSVNILSLISSSSFSSPVIPTTITTMQFSSSATSQISHLNGELNSMPSLTKAWDFADTIASDTSRTDELQINVDQSYIESKVLSFPYNTDITAHTSENFDFSLAPNLSTDMVSEVISTTESVSGINPLESSVVPSNNAFDLSMQTSSTLRFLTDSFTELSSETILQEGAFTASSMIDIISDTPTSTTSNIATDADLLRENLYTSFEISTDKVVSDYVSDDATLNAFISIPSTSDEATPSALISISATGDDNTPNAFISSSSTGDDVTPNGFISISTTSDDVTPNAFISIPSTSDDATLNAIISSPSTSDDATLNALISSSSTSDDTTLNAIISCPSTSDDATLNALISSSSTSDDDTSTAFISIPSTSDDTTLNAIFSSSSTSDDTTLNAIISSSSTSENTTPNAFISSSSTSVDATLTAFISISSTSDDATRNVIISSLSASDDTTPNAFISSSSTSDDATPNAFISISSTIDDATPNAFISSSSISDDAAPNALISIPSTSDVLNFATVLNIENSITSSSPLPLQSSISSSSSSSLSSFSTSSLDSNQSSFPLSTSFPEQSFLPTTPMSSLTTLPMESINSNTIVESSFYFYSADQTTVLNLTVNVLHTVSSTYIVESEHDSSTTYVSDVFLSQFTATPTTMYSDMIIEDTKTDTLNADILFPTNFTSDGSELLLAPEYITSYLQSSLSSSTSSPLSWQEFTSVLTSASSPLIATSMTDHTSSLSQPVEVTSKSQSVLHIMSVTESVPSTISSTSLLNSASRIPEILESESITSHMTSLTSPKPNEINATSSKSLLTISSMESLNSETFSSATSTQYHTTIQGTTTLSGTTSVQPSFESNSDVNLPQTQLAMSLSSEATSTVGYVINSFCTIDACLFHEPLQQMWMFSGESVFKYGNNCEEFSLTGIIENRPISDIFQNDSLVGPINGAFFNNDEINLIKGTYIFTFNASTIDTEPATKQNIQTAFGGSFPSLPDAVTADNNSTYFIKDGMLYTSSNGSVTVKYKPYLQGVTATCHLCNNTILGIFGQDMFIIDKANDTKIEVGKILC